jgi:hypothetical protein
MILYLVSNVPDPEIRNYKKQIKLGSQGSYWIDPEIKQSFLGKKCYAVYS